MKEVDREYEKSVLKKNVFYIIHVSSIAILLVGYFGLYIDDKKRNR